MGSGERVDDNASIIILTMEPAPMITGKLMKPVWSHAWRFSNMDIVKPEVKDLGSDRERRTEHKQKAFTQVQVAIADLSTKHLVSSITATIGHKRTLMVTLRGH